MTFKKDCIYYSKTRLIDYRADCERLQREIKPKECINCGWYRTRQEVNEMWRERKFKQELEGKVE